jgi:hypothetical protein
MKVEKMVPCGKYFRNEEGRKENDGGSEFKGNIL